MSDPTDQVPAGFVRLKTPDGTVTLDCWQLQGIESKGSGGCRVLLMGGGAVQVSDREHEVLRVVRLARDGSNRIALAD